MDSELSPQKKWRAPGKNCGNCGAATCKEFEECLISGEKALSDCPFYKDEQTAADLKKPFEGSRGCGENSGCSYTGSDILDIRYDFVLHPIGNEPSARKIILPFRPDITERLKIVKGDILLGRPQGAGCPVQHVLSVIDADYLTGVITSHVVSPMIARENPGRVKEIRAYHIAGFEGVVQTINNEPRFGRRQKFLPGFCMMNLAHTGVVSMLVEKESGLHARVEDIRII